MKVEVEEAEEEEEEGLRVCVEWYGRDGDVDEVDAAMCCQSVQPWEDQWYSNSSIRLSINIHSTVSHARRQHQSTRGAAIRAQGKQGQHRHTGKHRIHLHQQSWRRRGRRGRSATRSISTPCLRPRADPWFHPTFCIPSPEKQE